jgi:hypothetical protein
LEHSAASVVASLFDLVVNRYCTADTGVDTSVTAGGFHDPSRMEGGFSFGQYIRSIRTNFPAGAGSQFDSLSAPGESFWI